MTQLPAVTTSLSAAPGDQLVRLIWSPVAGVTGYKVYRAESPDGQTEPPITTTTSILFTDTSLTNDTTYYYKIVATNAAGDGPYSNEVSATPQSSP